MAITKNAQNYHERMFPGYESKLLKTDPEFIELFDNFAFDEVVNQNDLDDKTSMIAMKEIIYQATAYLGIGRVFPFLHVVNDFCTKNGITLPLQGQSTTNQSNRLEKGIQAQVDIFGQDMCEFYKSGTADIKHINYWLTDNCFGDYYTRKGLDYKQREMITFCFLAAQGGCEPQLVSHIEANIRLGNDRAFLIKVISRGIPFLGYPRSLNALRCINEVIK